MLSIGVVWTVYNSPAILRLGLLTLAAATPRMFSTREFGATQLCANTSSQTGVSRHARRRVSKVVHLADPGRIVPVSDSGQPPSTSPSQPTGTDPAGNATWRWQERAGQWLDFPLGRFLGLRVRAVRTDEGKSTTSATNATGSTSMMPRSAPPRNNTRTSS